MRSVDSSLERIQVKFSGVLAEGRYVVACNGRKVPLHPTGESGENPVAGLRYRARKLSSTLHPTIPVHMPLKFDLIDLWRDCPLADVLTMPAPPTAVLRSRPANATEAKERRAARFQISTDCASRWLRPTDEMNPVFPMTLDMRRPALARKPPIDHGERAVTTDLYQTPLATAPLTMSRPTMA